MGLNKKIAIWGSTGSIGTQTLDIVYENRDLFSVETLTSHVNINKLFEQALKVSPEFAVITGIKRDQIWIEKFKEAGATLLFGKEGLLKAASESGEELVLNALVGRAGLEPTVKAIEAGKDIALANKEVLVMAGDLILRKIRKHSVKLIPVDSEHSAVYQCLAGEKRENIKRIILTASGGPFFRKSIEEIKSAGVKEALAHPNWDMGKKVTIDSATMMNKGFEVIEARYLFDIPVEKIEVIIHPESIIHSMVEFCDGSVKAQLGNPDMHVPIQYALTCPDRLSGKYGSIDFSITDKLTFLKPDTKKFKCLDLAFKALKLGGTSTAVLNGADEAAVELFLGEHIKFIDIPEIIQHALNEYKNILNPGLNEILNADNWARNFVYNNYSRKKDKL